MLVSKFWRIHEMSSPTWEEEIEARLDTLLSEIKVTQQMIGNCMEMPVVQMQPKKETPVTQAPPKQQDGKTEYSPINTLQVGEQSSKQSKIIIKGTLEFNPNHREGTRRDGTEYEVTDIVLNDGTGKIQVSFWGDKAQEPLEYQKGDLVLIENLYQVTGTYGDKLQANAGKYYKMCKLN